MKRQWLIRAIALFPILGVIFSFYGSFTLTKYQTKRLEAEFIHNEKSLPASVENSPEKTEAQEPFEFKGIAFGMEQAQLAMDDMRKKYGRPPIPPIKYPYRERLEKIFKEMEKRGYNRAHFYKAYESVVSEKTFSERTFKKAVKTSEFATLFKQNNIQAIQERIQNRLKKNQYDIPALLIQKNLHGCQRKFEQLFEDLEKILIAVDHFSFTSVPKEAILYEIYRTGTSYGYYSEEDIKAFKNRKNKNLVLGSAGLLCVLENAGEW